MGPRSATTAVAVAADATGTVVAGGAAVPFEDADSPIIYCLPDSPAGTDHDPDLFLLA